ncbi:molybdopterin dinucleotide binding domain-containing protein, partial [Nocardia cyriacigeorgica]|uniref:molybdopterin dinucleotide binding domain-containing protein n=1 Tax=Nocardia cyriacigeorgica TaxID=135487 RepID=UPI0024589844
GRKGLTATRTREAAGGTHLAPCRPRLPELIGTRDRKVQLAPPDFLRAITSVLDDAAAGRALTAPGEGFDLKLIGRRHLRSNNSWLHNIPTMMKGRDRCTVLMHPVDATERGLAEGDSATVASPVGAITLPVEISDDIRRGVVAIPHGWGHGAPGVGWSVAAAQPGVNVNLLHDPSLTDPLSGAAAVNNTWVRVSAVTTDPAATAAVTFTAAP